MAKLFGTLGVIAALIILLAVFASQRQPSTAIAPGSTAGDRLVLTVRGVPFPFRWVPAGTFKMGSPESEEDRDPVEIRHSVEITKGYWILETETTQPMYKIIDKGNPSAFQGENLPVDSVTWDDANVFCEEFNRLAGIQSGWQASLPTEAEWEYACRAQTFGAWAGPLESIAWYGEPTESGSTHPVASKEPNDWDIYDMQGNLWEWCLDRWSDYTEEDAVDPTGPSESNAEVRIDRGGCWDSPADQCRSAYRGTYERDRKSRFVGFRFVLRQTDAPAPSGN